MLEGLFYERSSKSNAHRYVKLQRGVLSQYVDIKQSSPFNKISLTFQCSFEAKKQSISLSSAYILKIFHPKGEVTLATDNKSQFEIWRDKLFLTIPRVYHQKVWKETKKIGSGNFSDVQRVTDYQGRMFAIKTIAKSNVEKDKIKQLKAIQNQINIMKTINSPNLVSILGIYANDKNYYLKLPFYEGGTLSFLKKQKLLTTEDTRIAMKDLLNALVELKKCKIIHRDIKPDNIVMHKENGQKRFILIDFGLATFSDAQYIYYRCGTPGYVSPQVANMSSKQARIPIASDVFSLGAVFYFLIIGKMLFSGNNGDSILYKNRKCSINYNSEQFSKFWPDQKDLIMKMLQKNHSFRITPQEALNHPYFTRKLQFDEFQQIPEEENDLSKKISKLVKLNIKEKSPNFSIQASVQFQSVVNMSSHQSNFLTFQNIQNQKVVKSPHRTSIQKQYRHSHFLQQSKKKSRLYQLTQQNQQ